MCIRDRDEAYQEEILPKSVAKRVVVEAGSSMSWGKYAGIDGCYVTMDEFGASAPAGQLFEKYGFTADAVVNCVRKKFPQV